MLNKQIKYKGLPPKDLTEKEWNNWFKLFKINNIPSSEKRYNNKSQCGSYCDKTESQWYRYKQYINGCLTTIRQGDVDYCYYINQVIDLLRFEPELNCKYHPDNMCFSIWL